MDFQILFNIALGAFSGLGGWLLNNLHQSMRELAKADAELVRKVNSIEVLVAGQYVTRNEFNAKIDAMFVKLDSIDEKLDARIANYRKQ